MSPLKSPQASADNMNNRPEEVAENLDIPETDLSGAVRGKYYERAVAGTNVVLLEPDVARVFRDSAVVSQALRDISRNTVRHRPKRQANRWGRARISSDVFFILP
jgi:hypothetical protein